MPLIVDEVVISVEVAPGAAGQPQLPPTDADSKQELIAQCVERVLEILREREEP